ncbi:MAG: quinone-dependent dihydroorotate dehydrogenase [Acidobacteriota bacterium]
MSDPLWTALKPLVFSLDAELAHELGLGFLAAVSRSRSARGWLEGSCRFGREDDAASPVEVFGLRFPNRFGLAAGCDKDGRAVPALFALGFGFVEVGTVTPRPQSGNPRPRMFRAPGPGALVNRLGFNSRGAEVVAAALSALDDDVRSQGVLGINLGKNKLTSAEDAAADYAVALRALHGLGDYFVVNVSSPNTPGLRDLQSEQALEPLLREVVRVEAELAEASGTPSKPVLLKLAPDLSDEGLEAALAVAESVGITGLIATNTTLARPECLPPEIAAEAGGLSGAPLLERALEVVARIHARVGDSLPVIGVGGVSAPDDARRMLDAGASLVQAYTGFVYGGPRWVGDVVGALGEGR